MRGGAGVLGDFDGLVCDLDGVVYRGDEPIAGAVEAVESLRARGVSVLFTTNNSRSTVGGYVEKLERLGISAGPDDVLTSAVVTRDVLAERGMSGARAVVIGGDGVREELRRARIEIEERPDATTVDLVVVGWDPHFDYDAMRRASLAVRSGADLVATNDDAAFPAPDGLWPGAGAILASIEVASGGRAEVMGKPHAPMMEAAARRLAAAGRIAVVGDRPETDLEGGRSRGWPTILVLSGVTSREQAAGLDPPPDLIVDSLADLASSPF
jgi:phosphoglycolate/pyridoxal phosphate phosphatase family enzyme